MRPKSSKLGVVLAIAVVVHLLCSSAFAKRLPIRIFTSADGLGSSFVNYVTSDSRGFLWFCTRDGLSRFDGSRFVTYQITARDSPPGIENLYEARDGIYWITTTGGTYRFDPNKLSTPNGDAPTLNAERVTDHRGLFYEDSVGNFWLGTVGLYRLERRGETYHAVKIEFDLPADVENSFSVTDIDETAGSLWINTNHGLIRRLSDERIVFYPDDIRENVGTRRMMIDLSGRVWVLRGDQIIVIKPESPEVFAGPEKRITRPLMPTRTVDIVPEGEFGLPKLSGEIIELKNRDFIDTYRAKQPLQTADGSIWFAGEENLIEITDGIVHLHSRLNGLPSVMGRMAEDNVGNLWIAGRAGVTRLDRKGLVTYGREDGAASDRVLSIGGGPDGMVYFGTSNANISRFDGTKLQSVRPGVPPGASHIWTARTAFVDSRGDWWMLTSDKLYRFSAAKTFEMLDGRAPSAVYGRENGFRGNAMVKIFEDSAGDIWVSTRSTGEGGNGLSRLKNGEDTFIEFSEAQGYPADRTPSSFVEDRNGNVWIGLYEGGLLRYDGERFVELHKDERFPQENITDLHIDGKGRLWVSSSAIGLLRIDDLNAEKPEFLQFTTGNGLSSNNVRAITEDRFGRIYLGTARGVDRLTPDTGRVRRYSQADGLAGDFVHDAYCDRNGDLWFATDNGMSRLIPSPDEKSAPPKVWLGGLRVAGEYQPTLELGAFEINVPELTDRQNNLQFEFFGIDFRAGEQLRYQYKLEGANADWSEPSENRSVNFANLRAANYRFLVRAVNSDGIVSDTPAVVAFTILPPIWARWWFLLIVAVAAAALIILVYRYRTNRLRELNLALTEAKTAEEKLRRSREERIAELERVRARIASDLHDDIGASLTQIAILSEVAQARSNGDNGSASEPLSKITDVSNELVGTMSDIVWSINPAKDHVSDLAQRMRRFASDVFASKNIKFQFLAPGTEGETVLSSNIRREVFLIFKETVNNIVKHSGASSARLELAVENGEVSFRISDDGVGFDTADPKPVDGGHGLNGMRRRVEEMNGKLQIISQLDAGTTVSLTLPLTETASG